MLDIMFSDVEMKDCGLLVAKAMKDRLAIKHEEELVEFVNGLSPFVLRDGVKNTFPVRC